MAAGEATLARRAGRWALAGACTGALVAVPLVFAGEKRWGEAALAAVALVGFVLQWLDVPTRVAAAWRRLVRQTRRVGAVVPGVGATAVPVMPAVARVAVRPRRPTPRYGRQARAIAARAARGQDPRTMARELRIPSDVAAFALLRRAG
jgi:hypothetical protein